MDRKIRRLLFLGALFAFMLVALPASGQTEPPPVSEGVIFNLEWLNVTIGFFLPFVISAFKRRQWSIQVKRIVSFFIAAIVGVVTVGFQAEWVFASAQDFLKLAVNSVVDIFVVSQVAYLSMWKDTAPERALESIGSNTV